MKWEVIKPILQPIGRSDEMVHWHRIVMRVVGLVEASSSIAAIAAAKKAGHSAPIVQLADDAAAARFTAKIKAMGRVTRETAEVA